MPGTILDNLATSVNNLNKVLILVAITFYWVEINDKEVNKQMVLYSNKHYGKN